MFALFLPFRLQVLVPWTTLAACVLLVAGDVVLSVITPGYDMASETSSQLMSPDARYSAIARILLGLYAVLLIPLAVHMPGRLASSPGRSAWLRCTGVALAVSATWVHIGAAIVSAVAANDSAGGLVGGINANDVHDQAAIVMFAAALGVVAGSALARFDVIHPASTRITLATLIVFMVLGPVFVAELWTNLNGVLERALAATFMLWMSVTALRGDHVTEGARRP